MGLVNRLPRRVVVAALVLVFALLGGVAWYSFPRYRPEPQPDPGRASRVPPSPFETAETEHLRNVGQALHSVKVGMRRAEVEALVGRPDAKAIGAIDPAGKVYQTRHRAYVTEPLAFAPEIRGLCEAVMEYDASRAGHPLLRFSCSPLPTGGQPAAVMPM